MVRNPFRLISIAQDCLNLYDMSMDSSHEILPASLPDEQLSKKERRWQKRLEKQQTHAQEHRWRKARKMYKILGVLLAIGIAVMIIVTLAKKAQPISRDYSKEFQIQGREHIPIASSHPPYNSNPPTSGWHYEEPADIEISNTELPDEKLVHNLEHGHIWISYHPRVGSAVIATLERFASSVVIVTPRSANDTDIALAAWGRLDTFNLDGKPLDTVRINDFITRWRNHGPERVPISAHFQ